MTREEFKQKWEADEEGSGITFDDIADCAKEWGLFDKPKCCDINIVLYEVLKAAKCVDAEEFKPDIDRDMATVFDTKTVSKEFDDITNSYYKKGYEDAINKACEWLEENVCNVYNYKGEEITIGFVEKFKRAMEE